MLMRGQRLVARSQPGFAESRGGVERQDAGVQCLAYMRSVRLFAWDGFSMGGQRGVGQ